jgi:2-aminoadipate transaminase
MARALAVPDLVSLAAGFVDQATLPVNEALTAVNCFLTDEFEGRRALQYGTVRGDLGLRKRLLERLEQSERAAPGSYSDLLDRLIVTSGSQQLLYLVTEVLLDPGDIVLVESPTYFVFLAALQSRGARVIGVETDDGGMRMDALEGLLAELEARGELERVKLIYTVSEHSNPTGLSLAADRRGEMVATARRYSKRHRIYVLEDAAYRGLTFEGSAPPSVWSHDLDGETVILARTFSKTFSPGLRLGYGVVPEALVRPILNLKANHDFGSTHFNQVLLERVLADDRFDRHVDLLRQTYRRKCDAMVSAISEHFSSLDGTVSWTQPTGGLYVWITLPEGMDTGRDGPLFSRCLKEGVLYVPGVYFYSHEPGPAPTNHARLTFGVTSEAGLSEGIRRLAVALAGCLDPVA